NLLTMRDGRIVKMEDFFDLAAAERAFSRTNPATRALEARLRRPPVENAGCCPPGGRQRATPPSETPTIARRAARLPKRSSRAGADAPQSAAAEHAIEPP